MSLRILNQKGAGLLPFILVVGLVGIVITIQTAERSLGVTQTGKLYYKQIKNREIQSNLELIFNNNELCKALANVSGSTYTLGAILAPAISLGGARVTSMSVENIQTVSPGVNRADFTVFSEMNGAGLIQARNSVAVIYQQLGTAITSCELAPDPQTACTRAGANWIVADNRCGICEKMGGNWSSGSCHF